jgi:concanavalin A-like lectin/glucanase superfamily protein
MSKKKEPASLKAIRRARRRKYLSIAAIGLIVTLGFAASRYPWRNLPRATSVLPAAPVPSPTLPPANNPSKEYIYAGSKLVATEAGKSDQTINFNTIGDKTFGDGPFALSAVASSGLPISFTITSGPATVSGSTLTINGAGSVSVRADQAGNDSFNTAEPVTQSFTVAKASQTINFNALAGKTYGDAPFTVSASSSSGLAVSFSILSGSATISGSTVTITGAGTVTVRAAQAGDGNYNAATVVDRPFTVAKASQTITFNALADKTYGDAPFTVSASSSSSLPVSFSIFAGPATISGSTVTITGAGTVTVRAAQAGNGNYNAAGVVDQPFTVAKAAQTITFNALAGKTYSDAPFTVSASSSSGLAVSFSILSGPATISGNTVTITGAGTVTVRASQAGNTNYNAAATADQSFTVAKASQTITFNTLAGKTYGDAPFTVSASSSSGLAVSFSILSGPANISGSTVTITGAGTVTVRASQAGNTNYNAAATADQSFTVAKASQTITFNTLAGKTYGDAPFTVSASSSSGLAVSFSILSGPATISGGTVTITGAGTVTVRAAQAGDGNYNAAAPVDRPFTVAKASQTITFNALAGKTYGDVPFTVSASSTSSLAVSFSILSGPATISGSTVTITGAGTVTVRAAQAGDTNYNAATSIDRPFIVAKATPTITWGNPADIFYGTALGGAQLNAIALLNGSSVAGVFNYSPGLGTVLNTGNGQTLSTTFTPADGANFNNAGAGALINVLPAAYKSLSLVGSNQYVNVPNSTSINITGPVTVEAWFKTSINNATQSIVARFGSAPDNDGGYIIYITNLGKLLFSLRKNGSEGDSIYGATTVTTGVWHHVAGVFDGQQLRVYLDGVLDGSKASVYAPFSGIRNLYIGNAGGYFQFYGLIDEVRLATGALYTANFTPPTHLSTNASTRGLWKFDGPTPNDFSGNSNNGTLTNNPSYSGDIPGAVLNSLSLNGSNQYLNVPNSSSLNITGSVTLEAWIKTNSNTTYQSIIERYGAYPGTNDGGYILRLFNTGKVQFATLRNAGDADFLYGATTITTGVWHHVAGVFDGTQMRIYLDGVLDASKSSTFAPVTGITDVRIGITGQNNTLFPFNGLIDEARISAAAVYTANFSPATSLTSSTNTRGLWKFDGQSPSDFSGNSNNGTLVNGASYSTTVP